MYYHYLGNNQYRITLVVYRDCINGQAPFDPEASLGIFNSQGNLVQNILVPVNDSSYIPNAINSPCLTPPLGICDQVAGKNMERHVYHESHTLHCGVQPLSANGFRLDKDSKVHTMSNCNAHRRSIVNLDARPLAMACRVPSECHPSGVRAEWRR